MRLLSGPSGWWYPYIVGMPLDTYRLWKRNNQDVGCVFARYMATKPAEFGQRAVAISGRKADAVATQIASRITEFVEDPDVVAAAIVLPNLTSLTAIVRVALALGDQAAWKITRSILRGTPDGDVVAFNVVRHVPMGDKTCPSEALLLGPFKEFPNTRRAPVTAMELFVGVPPMHKHSGEPTTKVHLADVPIQLPAASVFDNMWNNSVKLRLQSLGGVSDERAKARVTFSIPMALATKLDCVP